MKKGYTLIELMVVIGFLFVLVGISAIVYTAAHFISKYW